MQTSVGLLGAGHVRGHGDGCVYSLADLPRSRFPRCGELGHRAWPLHGLPFLKNMRSTSPAVQRRPVCSAPCRGQSVLAGGLGGAEEVKIHHSLWNHLRGHTRLRNSSRTQWLRFSRSSPSGSRYLEDHVQKAQGLSERYLCRRRAGEGTVGFAWIQCPPCPFLLGCPCSGCIPIVFPLFWIELWANHRKWCWVWHKPVSFTLLYIMACTGWKYSIHWFSWIKTVGFQDFPSLLQFSKIFANGGWFIRWTENFTWLIIVFHIRMLGFVSENLSKCNCVGIRPRSQVCLGVGEAPRGLVGKINPHPNMKLHLLKFLL